jgi:hypothetical protein
MKPVFLGAVACLSLFCGEAAAQFSGQQKEDWSPSVDGVRGRLIFAPDSEFSGTTPPAVCLEIQNTSHDLAPKEIFFDPSGGQLRWMLSDQAGVQIPQSRAAAADIFQPYPYWILLPFHSTLRFQVSVAGYAFWPNDGVALQLPGAFWQVPGMKRGAYFLSATFSSPALAPVDPNVVVIVGPHPVDEKGHHAWHGTLVLPKVSVPQ